MVTESEQPKETPVVEDKAAVKVEEKAVDDTTPLTFDELIAVGKEAVTRIRDIPLKPMRRGVRTTVDSILGAIDSAAKSVAEKRFGKDLRDKDQ